MRANPAKPRLLPKVTSFTSRRPQWREILLVEDNSARAQRRRMAGVSTPSALSPVVVRIHRITASANEVLAVRTYRAGSLKHLARRGGRAAVALELIDGLRPRGKRAVIVAGPVYGCNAWFREELARRDLHYVVEVRPSTHIGDSHTCLGSVHAAVPSRNHSKAGATKGSARVAAKFLGRAKWKSIGVLAPGAATPLEYRLAPLADVHLPAGRKGCLFAVQTGGILGVHRGTIFGISSSRAVKPADLVGAVGWSRWIRPTMRREERRSRLSSRTKHVPRADRICGVGGTPLAVRANITLARRQDSQAAWHQQELPFCGTPLRGAVASPVLNVVELFAGAGGMGLGFLLAGGRGRHYRIIFSGEVNPIYVETLKNNHNAFARQGHRAREDQVPERVEPIDLRTAKALGLVEHAARREGGVHLLVGGPPCQGFSNANRNSWDSRNPNNRLIDVFVKYIEMLHPPVFLLENVQGILWTPRTRGSMAAPTVVDHLARRMAAAGYEVFPKLLDAVWYGAPQYRSRFFLVGLRRDLGYRTEDFGQWGPFPLPTHGPGCSQPYVTVREAIGDLPRIGNGEDRAEQAYEEPSLRNLRSNAFLGLMRAGAARGAVFDHITSCHAKYVIERYRRIPQGGNWQDIVDTLTNYADVGRTHSNIYRRLKWSEPSVTIGHYRKSMLVHPSQHRGLSLREASRLQGLPDWFRFAGNTDGRGVGLVHKQQQVANAVCPLVAMALAEFILNL